MFGLGVTEILLLLMLAGMAWLLFKRQSRPRRRPDRGADGDAMTFARCEVCGSYMAEDETMPCGRSDCPLAPPR